MSGCHGLRVAILIPFLFLPVVDVVAQETNAGASSDHHQVISGNPFGVLLLGWFNAEYERKVTKTVALGLSGSGFPWTEGGGFYSVTTALKYYPGGTLFKGFYVAPKLGLFWLSRSEMDQDNDLPSSALGDPEWNSIPDDELMELQDLEVGTYQDSTLGVGFEVGYAWLLGSKQHLSVSIGAGAIRLFNGGAYPVPRLINIGWAF